MGAFVCMFPWVFDWSVGWLGNGLPECCRACHPRVHIILTHRFCPGRIMIRRNYTHTRKIRSFPMEAVALIASVRPIVEFVFQE